MKISILMYFSLTYHIYTSFVVSPFILQSNFVLCGSLSFEFQNSGTHSSSPYHGSHITSTYLDNVPSKLNFNTSILEHLASYLETWGIHHKKDL
jgi:hypothetical protein